MGSFTWAHIAFKLVLVALGAHCSLFCLFSGVVWVVSEVPILEALRTLFPVLILLVLGLPSMWGVLLCRWLGGSDTRAMLMEILRV